MQPAPTSTQAAPSASPPLGPQVPVWRLWLRRWWPLLALVLFCLFLIINVGIEEFLRYTLLGLPQGGIIALIAIGYSMVYGIILLINFAHGEIFMFAAYLMLLMLVPVGADAAGAGLLQPAAIFAVITAACWAVTVWAYSAGSRHSVLLRAGASLAAGLGVGLFLAYIGFRSGLPFFVAFILAVLLAPAYGVTMDTVAYKPLRNSPRLVPLITAIGMSFLLQNVAQMIFGPQQRIFPQDSIPEWLQTGSVPEPGMDWWTVVRETHRIRLTDDLYVPLINAVIVILALGVMLATNWFVQKSRTGKAMRACALDQTTARLVGINVNATVAITFAIGSALAAVAAPFWVLQYALIEPTMGYIVGILAFASAVLGGIGNIKGAMIGGFTIGIIYNLVPLFDQIGRWRMVKWLSERPAFAHVEDWNFLQGISEWRLGIAYLFMILVIIFRPTGLLGQSAASRRA